MDKTIAYKYVELSEDAEICILFLCGHTQRRTFLMSEAIFVFMVDKRTRVRYNNLVVDLYSSMRDEICQH